MAILLTKVNRLTREYDWKSYYLSFFSRELNGEIKPVKIACDMLSCFPNEKTKNLFLHDKFYSLEHLEMYFPGISNAKVLRQREGYLGSPIFDIDYISSKFYSRKNLYKKLDAYKNLKLTAKHFNCTEYFVIADAYIEFCKTNNINEIEFLYQLSMCNKYDLNALKSGLYILENNIRATKVRFCSGARMCWDALGFKSEILNGVRSVRELKDEVGKSYCNYVFLTEKKIDDKHKDVEAKELIEILEKLPQDAEIKTEAEGLFAVTGANYEDDSIFLRLELIGW